MRKEEKSDQYIDAEKKKFKKLQRNEKCLVFLYVLWIILVIFYNYFISPVFIILNLYSLFAISPINPNGKESDGYALLKPPFPIIAILLILVFPLIYIFVYGLEIISIQQNILQKFIAVLLIIWEGITHFPVPFLYDNNMFSLYLYSETGVEKLIAPWLVFYPTNFMTSILETVRNIITGIFIIVISFIKYNQLIKDPYTASYTSLIVIAGLFTIIMVSFNILFLIIGISRKVNNKKKDDDAYIQPDAEENIDNENVNIELKDKKEI